MTPSEIIVLVNRYDQRLAVDMPEAKAVNDGGTERSHIRWMCERVAGFAKESPDKANRWLGFIQGYFWVNGDYSIEALREHNR